jgi:GNAT superfamily N-acetyltransferase
MPTDLEIKPLTPSRLPDLASLFGQGGDPKWCWCAFFRVRGMTWSNSNPPQNRKVLEKAVRTDARQGHAPGLVAYRDREAVGWVSLGPREEYDRLEHSTVLARVDDRPVWSIVCFVVGRKARGQGVAAALLDAAVAYARDHGARLLEAYPVDTSGGRVPAANAFHGTLGMFERAGFRVVERRQFNKASPVRPIVRRGLRPRARTS